MRYTIKNSGTNTFRIPLQKLGEFRIVSDEATQAAFGDIVNLIGRIEAYGFSEKELIDILEFEKNRRKK